MIFLVRHGEAAAGWGDHPDPGLSDLGKKQAEAVAATLANLGAKSAISSPMLRCRETALPFEQRMGLVARVAPEVSEIDTPDDVEDRVLWLRTLMGGDWQGGAGPAGTLRLIARLPGLAQSDARFCHQLAR